MAHRLIQMPRKKGVTYTKKIADYILTEIEKGRSLTSICKEDNVPTYRSVQQWVRDDKNDFTRLYKQARETQLNLYIDQMHDIADAPPPVPPEFVKNDKGEMVPLAGADRKLWVNAEVQRRRLKIDTIKFIAGKLAGVMGYNNEKSIQVVGDTINILNYAVAPPSTEDTVDVEVAEVNFLEVPSEG